MAQQMAAMVATGPAAAAVPRLPSRKAGLRAVSYSSALLKPKAVRSCRPAPVTCILGEDVSKRVSSVVESAGKATASLSLAALLALAPMQAFPAQANEIDILLDPVPNSGYIIDDARVLSRAGSKVINEELDKVEKELGYRINVVTVRKLEFTPDSFEFADKVLEKWYPTVEEGDKKAVLLLVTTSKEGALSAGPSLNNALGDALIESVSTENIPILGSEEKYNEALITSIKRITAKLRGEEDPGAPGKSDVKRVSNFRSKEETENKRGQFSTVVIGLLIISVVAPMLQYFSYVSKEK